MVLLLVLGGVAPTHGQELDGPWDLCGPYDPPMPRMNHPLLGPGREATLLNADEGQAVGRNEYRLLGNIRVERGTQWLTGDEAVYHQPQDTVDVSGNVALGDLNLSMEGRQAHLNLTTRHGWVDDALYRLHDKHGRGTADKILIEGESIVRLRGTRYTTCDPDDNDWYLHSPNVKLNRAEGFGSATNVFVTFQHVPILYFPYLTFPIDDRRKSGFLLPSIGSSSQSGDEFSLPYYLNLAPNYDATITPHYMAKRGVQGSLEFRYLLPRLSGQWDISYLPDDELYGDDRYFAAYTHTGRPAQQWETTAALQYVSDKDYFADLADSLSTTAVKHLEQNVQLAYYGANTSARARVQAYQPVDPAVLPRHRPYRRLPQLELSTSRSLAGNWLMGEFQGEFVNFDQKERLTAERLDLQPSLVMPLEGMAGFVIPKYTWRFTQYEIDDPGATSRYGITRDLPTFSVDSGLFFERDLTWGSTPILQTLEPRVFYLYVPYEDQSDIPVFDTSLTGFGFGQLFRTNRFNGADRVGDANQYSVTLTTRFIDQETGVERIRARVGQIFYDRDRRVSAGRSRTFTPSQSDIVADAVTRITDWWTTRSEVIWNSQTDRVDEGSFTSQVRFGTNKIFNAAYHYTRQRIEQTDYSILWPLHRRWSILGRYYYSHPDDRPLETIAGVEYRSCCWAFRILNRRIWLGAEDGINEILMMQLELKGLTRIGNPIEAVMEESIPGFETDPSAFSIR